MSLIDGDNVRICDASAVVSGLLSERAKINMKEQIKMQLVHALAEKIYMEKAIEFVESNPDKSTGDHTITAKLVVIKPTA